MTTIDNHTLNSLSPQLKTMVEGFSTYQKPNLFLSSFATKHVLATEKVQLDKRSVKNVYAMDSEKGGARMVNFNNFETHEYTLPYFNLYSILTPEQFTQRAYGQTEYEQIGNLNTYVNERQGWLSDMLNNAVEKMAVDALYNNRIVMVNHEEIEFNRKSTHYINKGNAKWSDVEKSNPIQDINDMAQLIIDDGRIAGGSAFNLICARDTVNVLLTNQKFKDNSKFDSGIKLTDIQMPTWNTHGATFHGQFSAGSARINLWSYNAKLEIPTGYGLAGEGELRSLIPNGTALLLGDEVRFDLYYAGIDNSALMINSNGFNPDSLKMVKAEQLPYAYWSKIAEGTAGFVYGVKSRPLFVPVNNDGFAICHNLV